MYREVNKEDVMEMLPEYASNLKSFISNISNAYFEASNNNKGILIDEVDIQEKQYAITIDLRNDGLEFIDDIVNPEHYNISMKSWNEMLIPLQEAIQEKNCNLIIDDKGNDDYLWASLKMPIKSFDKSILNELTELWIDFNNTIRNGR